MAPVGCSYFRCKNNSEHKSMFRFPWNDKNRLKVWLDNCGNMSIAHLPAEKLRTRYLCIDHFNTNYISKSGARIKHLLKNAIPEPYANMDIPESPSVSLQGSPRLKVLTPKKTYKNKKKELDIPEDDLNNPATISSTPRRRKRQNEADEDTPKCKKLKTLVTDINKKLKREQKKNTTLKTKINNKNVVDFSQHNFNSETSKLLATMQFRSKKSKKQWSNEEKKFCMGFYYASPAAYKFLLNSGVVLASVPTIQRWLQETNCLPGINNDVFENIKMIFTNKTIKERSCAVCFDEMSIMVDLEYTNKYDLIEGFEDFGGGDRCQKEAKYALVFVARGIYNNWKIPVAYFLSSKTVDSDKLGTLLDSVINQLFDCNLLPKVTVCDQATTNVKMIRKFGASVDYPFFFINGHKIYSIFDTPHLIKNIRNNLISSDFELDGNSISFNDIVNVYNIDKDNKSKSLKKLTPVHINPNNFQKMKVKLATQVLSNSVAGAIRTAINSGELKSSTAEHTADFVKLCNDLFDCLNSKNKFDKNPYRCAITKNQNTIVNQTLLKSKDCFNKLKKISFNKQNEKKLTRPPCFDGINQTINAVLQFSAEEFTEGTGVRFIITYRLNQDVIENLFGIYRIKGGCNRNPTAKSLRSMFRSNLLNNLLKFDKTNCESDEGVFVTQENTQHTEPKASTSSGVQNAFVIESAPSGSGATVGFNVNASDVAVSFEELSNPNSSNDTVTLEMCSVVYFAGWLGKSCIEKFNCADCTKLLIKNEVDLTDKKQLLLINKTYSNILTPTLKSPSDFLFRLVDQGLDCFNKNIDDLFRLNLVENLIKKIKSEIKLPGEYHDLNHFDYLIKKLLEVKIHDFCKSRKKSLQSAPKLRILQNK